MMLLLWNSGGCSPGRCRFLGTHPELLLLLLRQLQLQPGWVLQDDANFSKRDHAPFTPIHSKTTPTLDSHNNITEHMTTTVISKATSLASNHLTM